MKLKKSIKTLLVVIVLFIMGMIITKYILLHDKWLYYKISTINDSNKLIERNLVDLDGRWYVKSEDSLTFSTPFFKDEDWNTYRYLYMALLQNGKKTTWLRKHFVAPAQISADTLLLRLSLFDIQAQVYINGTKVADSCFVFNRSACCYIPTNLLAKGKSNLIAIRSQSMLPNPSNDIVRYKDEIVTTLQPSINLEGAWKFTTGDNEIWKNREYNDSSFKTLMVPQFWDNQGYKTYDGIAWYRKTFAVQPNIHHKKLLFITGKIDDFGEVYINGIKIGGHIIKTKDKLESDWDTYNLYLFDGNILTDRNTVAIRVIDNQLRGGIYQGPIGIISMDDYLKFIETKN